MDSSPVDLAREAIPPPNPAPRPWGVWMTWLWLLPISISVIISQIVVMVAFVLTIAMSSHQSLQSAQIEQFFLEVGNNGLALSLITIVDATLIVLLLAPIIWLRRMRYVDYLGLAWPSLRQIAACSALLVTFVVITDGLTALTGRPVVHDFMRQIHATAGFAPLLWFALVVAAPIGEELVFRGFLLAPRGSRLVAMAGLIGSSLVWAAMHLQYELFGIATIFAGGLLLGAIRLRTGSTMLTILMHALMNAIATVELYVQLYLLE